MTRKALCILGFAAVALPGALTGQAPVATTPIACEAIATPESGLVQLVAIGPNGAAAWTDGPRAATFHLSRPGQPTRVVGRDGEGPGEFRFIGALGWRADTLWATDTRLQRATAFVHGATLLRSAPLPRRGSYVARDDSSFVGSMAPIVRPGEMLDVASAPLTIGVVMPGSRQVTELQRVTVGVPSDATVLPSLLPASLVRGNRAGTHWCATASGGGDVTHIACVASDGSAAHVSRVVLDPVSLPMALWDEEVQMVARGMGVPPSAVTGRFVRPTSSRAAFDLLVNGATEVWLRRTPLSAPVAVWDRLSPDGRPLPRVAVPGRYQLRALDGSTAYAADTDSDGLQTLVRCRLGG